MQKTLFISSSLPKNDTYYIHMFVIPCEANNFSLCLYEFCIGDISFLISILCVYMINGIHDFFSDNTNQQLF